MMMRNALILIVLFSSMGYAKTETELVQFYSEVEMLRRLAESDPQDAIRRISQHDSSFTSFPDIAKIEYYSLSGLAHMHMHDYSQAQKMVEKGLDLYSTGDMSEASFYLMVLRGKIGEELGERGAIDFLEAATQMAEGMQRDDLLVSAYIDLVSFNSRFLQFLSAYDYLNKAYALVNEDIQSIALAELHFHRAIILKHVQRSEEAMEFAQLAQGIFEGFQRFGEIHKADILIADIYMDMGNIDKSENIIRKQISESQALGMPTLEARSKMRLIEFLIEQKRPTEALELLDDVEHLVISNRILGRTDRYALARLDTYLQLGDNESGAKLLEEIENGDWFDIKTQSTKSQIKQNELKTLVLTHQKRHRDAFYAMKKAVELKVHYEETRSQLSLQEVIVRDDTTRMARENEALAYDNEKQRLKLKVKEEQNSRRNWLIAVIIVIVAAISGIIFMQLRTHRKLYKLANYDSLTGVVNRRVLMSKGEDVWSKKVDKKLISQAWETSASNADKVNKAQCCIVMIDIDHFKKLNDTYGHCVGDSVLKVVAKVGSEVFGEKNNTFGRLGGEEFLAILPELKKESAETLIQEFTKGLELVDWAKYGIKNPVTTSIGVATRLDFDDDASFDYVLKQADIAMYKSKQSGRARITQASTA